MFSSCYFMPTLIVRFHCQECVKKLKLFVVRFTETETYTEVFNLHIEIMEPDCNVIKFGPQNLEVPEFYGLSNVLDGNIVSFHYDHRHSIECTVQLTTLETHLPAHGQLVTGQPEIPDGPRGDEPDSFVPLRRQLGKTNKLHYKKIGRWGNRNML